MVDGATPVRTSLQDSASLTFWFWCVKDCEVLFCECMNTFPFDGTVIVHAFVMREVSSKMYHWIASVIILKEINIFENYKFLLHFEMIVNYIVPGFFNGQCASFKMQILFHMYCVLTEHMFSP